MAARGALKELLLGRIREVAEIGVSTWAIADAGTPAGSWKQAQPEEHGSSAGGFDFEVWSVLAIPAEAQHSWEAVASAWVGTARFSNCMKAQ